MQRKLHFQPKIYDETNLDLSVFNLLETTRMKECLCFFVFFIGAQLLLSCDGSVSSISSSTPSPLLRRGRGGGEKILASLQNGNSWLATKLSSFMLEPLEEDESSQRPSGSQKKPCVPKSGHTAIGTGQDFDSILAYTSAFASSQPSPFSLMTYTAIHSEQGNLTGLTEVIDYGSGKQWLTGLAKAFPSSSLQVGLYLVNELSAIKAGVYDHHIDRFIRVLNETGRPIYLRIGYEFETERNNYDPEEYKFVFRKIAKRFEALSVNNVAFVWHAAVEDSPRGGLLYDDWYPGDDVVDWCGISLFQQPYQCQSVTKCFMIFPEQFTAYCASHEKPMMIAESTPFGGILDDKALAKDPDRKNGAGYQGNTWNNWFTPVIGFIAAHKDVRMWNYINCDWDSLPMYKSEKNHAPGVYWGDSRIQSKLYLLRFIIMILIPSLFS